MSNWVYDGTTNSGTLNFPKADGFTIPLGANPVQFVDALTDWNVVGQALTDLRFAVASGNFIGFGARFASGSYPVTANVGQVGNPGNPNLDFLFVRSDGALVQHRAAGLANPGDFVLNAAAANVLYQQYAEITLPTGSIGGTFPFGSAGSAIVYLKNNGLGLGASPALNRSQLVIRWSVDWTETVIAESPAL